MDQVTLPVSYSPAFLDDPRPQADMPAMRLPQAPVKPGMALTVRLRLNLAKAKNLGNVKGESSKTKN
jgi:hypothetical protein